MQNLLDKIKTRRCHLVLEEEDVIRVLNVINKHHRIAPNMRVQNCGWADSNKWFIHFDSTEYKWNRIRFELKVIRVFSNMDIPNDTKGCGNVYTTD